jgi:hypothetical protein
VVHVFLWWLQGFFQTRTERRQTAVYPMAAGQQDQLPPAPRLQQNPQQALRELRAAQQSQLTGYGWVDKDAGIARMPIEEAMRIVVERGLPVRQTVPAGRPEAAKTSNVTGPSKADTVGTGK